MTKLQIKSGFQWRFTTLMLFAVALLWQPAAVAQEFAAQRLSRAWLEAVELRDGVFNPPQQTLLNALAYHAAAANLCQGFRLNSDAFSAAFERLKHQDILTMGEDEQAYFERHLLVNFGIAVGIYLSEAALNEAVFCQDAEQHRSDPEAENYWQ